GAVDYMVKLPHPVELLARVRAQSRAYLSRTEREQLTTHLHKSMQLLTESNAQLVRVSREDGLTGLANRRALDQALDSEWRRAQRDQNELSFALIDLDFFKLYNDHYGHVRGDECLRTVAGAVGARARRPADVAARYGGEELGLLLPGTPAEGARGVAEEVRRAIADLHLPHAARNDGCAYVSASVGVATLQPAAGDLPRAMVEAADAALYQAKKRGRNTVVHATLDAE
ncbi:MAG: diguanylate cyclase, partial [Polyangiales bacterium]